jgi:VanZ family protein
MEAFHQAFVPGRYLSLLDVLVFDNLGVILGLGWYAKLMLKR